MSRQQTVETKEAHADSARRRRTVPWVLGGLVLGLLSIMIALQVAGLWSILTPDTASDTLLLYALSSLNFAAFIVFAFILVRSLLKLRRERHERQLGAKIKTRLVVYFITLSLLPITAMAVFSYLFLNRSIEKWFSNLPEGVVSVATQLQREADANQIRSLRETATMLALLIDRQPEFSSQSTLDQLVQKGNLAALEVVTTEGEMLAKSEAVLTDAERLLLRQEIINARTANEVKDDKDDKAVEHRRYDAVTVPLNGGNYLTVARERHMDSNLSENLSESQGQYGQLVAKQRKVRWLGISTLGLLTLLLLFASTWTALHLARGIAIPIEALAIASKEVARGNLEHYVTTIAKDELALLADSFNQMTAQLAENRRRIEAGASELREKNLALEERRNYIETVLESLSTGVVSLDESERITTINAAATTMLRLAEMPDGAVGLSQITSAEDRAMLERLLRRARRMGRASEQTELGRGSVLESEAIPVALTATALRAPTGETRGAVLVIEDLSELLSAQRAAAWSEVARRMAHEIKNPLTPIQLSAERIAKSFHRYAHEANGNGSNGNNSALTQERVAGIVDECTTTITREVAGLKAMVDEFSRFARLPHARLEAADLNEVVHQAVALYEDRLEETRMDVHLSRTLPAGMLDTEQMRRVFVNLIDNALESLAEIEGERRITVATGHDSSRGLLLVEIADTGQGIARADFSRLFQPYFSTRGRGTGLGLAIVQRIIIEHGGRIRAEMNRPRGAKFTIELPVTNA